MAFDDVFDFIGGAGLYQLGIFLLLSLPLFCGGLQAMVMTFLGPDQDHWCRVKGLENLTHKLQKYIAIPFNEQHQEIDHCHYFDLSFENLSSNDLNSWNWTLSSSGILPNKLPCDEWTYDLSEYPYTTVMKYNLVCERSYLVSLVYSSVVASTAVGYLIGGPLSDRFGRRWPLLVSSSSTGPLALAAAFAPNYPAFLLLRFLLLFSIVITYSCSFVLLMELLGPQYRPLAGSIYWISWSLGFLVLPAVAMGIKNSLTLQIVLAIPMFTTLTLYFFIPESPRWLITQKRFPEALLVIKQIAKINRKDIPNNLLSMVRGADDTEDLGLVQEKDETPDEKKSFGIWYIVREPLLCRYFLLLLPSWISCSLIYWSLSFNTGALAGNLYLNTFLSAFAEMPCYVVIPCIQKYGRRPSQAGSLILAGLACYISVIIQVCGNTTSHQIAANTFLFFGKALTSMAWIVVYMYTTELFPTPVRQVSVAFPNLLGNAFSLLAPFMGKPLMRVWLPLPMLIYGTLGLLSGVLLFLLPETKDTKLPDDISEVIGTRTNRGKVYKATPVKVVNK